MGERSFGRSVARGRVLLSSNELLHQLLKVDSVAERESGGGGGGEIDQSFLLDNICGARQ